MGLLSNLFGRATKYNDSQLVSEAMTALISDPLVQDASTLVVTSEKGVMTLTGVVQKLQEKDRIEGVVRSALTAKGLKHQRIINELRVPQSVQ